MWNLWSTLNTSCLALSVLFKKSMSFTDERIKFALPLFAICPATLNTFSLTALVSIARDAFLARSLRAGKSICGLATTGEISNTLVPQALYTSIEFLSCVNFTSIGSTFSYPHREFLNPRPPRTKFNPLRTHMHISLCGLPYTPRKCGFP